MKHGTQLVNVEPQPGFKLRLTYSDSTQFTLDFTDLIRSGGVYAALGDQAVFSSVRLDDSGSFIEFPGEIDFCADSLRHKAKVQQLQPAG